MLPFCHICSLQSVRKLLNSNKNTVTILYNFKDSFKWLFCITRSAKLIKKIWVLIQSEIFFLILILILIFYIFLTKLLIFFIFGTVSHYCLIFKRKSPIIYLRRPGLLLTTANKTKPKHNTMLAFFILESQNLYDNMLRHLRIILCTRILGWLLLRSSLNFLGSCKLGR